MKPFLKRIQILENQLFESLANARKLYSNKIDSKTFEELVSIDTSKTYKYIEKICKFYLQDPSIDFEELKNNIESFDRLSSKNLLDIKDINRFKTYNEFNEYISSNSDKMSKSEEQRLLKNKGTETILNNDKHLVLLIKNKKAAIQYGNTTKWCISATDSKNYFHQYRRNKVTFYFVFNKKLDSSNPLYKTAVAVYYNEKLECYNALDTNIPFSEIGLPKELFKVRELLTRKMLLKKVIKGSYKINSDGLIDVDGDVDMSRQRINSILRFGKFGTVTGDFDCSSNSLTSLDGCPEKVGGTFTCFSNNLTSLEGSPIKAGNFNCSFNNLESLDGCPMEVEGNFDCSHNKLISLKGCPEVLKSLNCSSNNLTSLVGCPTKLKGSFDCSLNNIESLNRCPTEVGGWFRCYKYSKVFTLEDILNVCSVNKNKIDPSSYRS